ncbi:hypothetical protein CRG98_043371 [Punica granatum]|uniref:Uncharacterized protein n=1 Tax=Punica granatum TaxID=22663 RepID=A0A2I0HWY1_PUNGR|nr:hypothetical protein CRG98_043371 [Punica granatum]
MEISYDLYKYPSRSLEAHGMHVIKDADEAQLDTLPLEIRVAMDAIVNKRVVSRTRQASQGDHGPGEPNSDIPGGSAPICRMPSATSASRQHRWAA